MNDKGMSMYMLVLVSVKELLNEFLFHYDDKFEDCILPLQDW